MLAAIRGTEIFFDVDGSGLIADGSQMQERRTALLVHGGPGTDHCLLRMRYAGLAAKLQLVYFDHRGHGRSARGKPDKYTLDENVEDMEALRRHLGLGRIVSIGTSYGGMVAMAHAARHPESVSHLILVATAAHSGFIRRALDIVSERASAEQVALAEDLFAGRLDTLEKLRRYFAVTASLYARRNDRAHSEVGLERVILSPEPLMAAFGPKGFLRTLDLRPELGAIEAPTLICAGRHDWICPPDFSEEIRQLIPGSDLRIFEESGHSIGSDEPQNLLDAVAGFLVYKRATQNKPYSTRG